MIFWVQPCELFYNLTQYCIVLPHSTISDYCVSNGVYSITKYWKKTRILNVLPSGTIFGHCVLKRFYSKTKHWG